MYSLSLKPIINRHGNIIIYFLLSIEKKNLFFSGNRYNYEHFQTSRFYFASFHKSKLLLFIMNTIQYINVKNPYLIGLWHDVEYKSETLIIGSRPYTKTFNLQHNNFLFGSVALHTFCQNLMSPSIYIFSAIILAQSPMYQSVGYILLAINLRQSHWLFFFIVSEHKMSHKYTHILRRHG